MRRTAVLAACLVCATLAMSVAASLAGSDDHARHGREHQAMRAALRRGEVLPLVRILTIVHEKIPGEVIEIELENRPGAWVYDIKVLDESGRVRKVKIDARNGTVRKVEDD